MAASKPERLGLAGEILLSLVAGAVITVLSFALHAAQVVPGFSGDLLRPGEYVARKLGDGHSALPFLTDVILYGLLPFLLLHVRFRRPPAPVALKLQADRRRAHRVHLTAPVFVYGWLRGEPFSESTETIDVCALGGSLPLSTGVIPAQTLLLTNPQSDQEAQCRIIHAKSTPEGKTLVGFEFVRPAQNFWQVDLASREAEVIHTA